MSAIFRIIPLILVYRHAVLSVGVTIGYFLLCFFLPSDDIVWYRTVVLVLSALYLLVHAVVAWRLTAVFSGGTDPLLYGTAVLFGSISLVFVSHPMVLWLAAVIVTAILLLTTLSPRIALFSFPFVHKGWRRLYSMAWTAVVFFATSFLYGANLFFSSLLWVIPSVLCAGVLLCATHRVIRLYISDTWKQERRMYTTLGFLYVQLSALLFLLPFGLFSLALLLTWVWYLVTLLCRFAVSPKGVIWTEQWRYLCVHAALFLIVLFWFLRWT